jgi:molecular chaperone DnaK
LFDVEVPLGREILDPLTLPVLDRTVATAREVLAEAGIAAGQLVAVFTTGGGARLPMVSTVLHRAFGLVPTIAAQPELVVAEGALYDSRPESPAIAGAPPHQAALGSGLVGAGAVRPPGVPTWPSLATPIDIPQGAASGRSTRTRTGWLAAAALLVLLMASATVFAIYDSRKADRDRNSGSDTSKATAGSVSPSASYPPGIDPCLLGAWRSISSEQKVQVDNGDVLLFVGPGGTVVDFRADKTVTYNYSATKPNTAKHNSVEWTVILRGTLTDHYEARGDRIFSDTIRSDATSTLNRNGQFYNVVTIEGDFVSTEYTCSGDTLIIRATDSYSSRLQRVTSTDPLPDPSGSPSA